MEFVTVQGHRLEYERIPASDTAAPVIVFLHEGLGSASHWRDFPRQVVAATGCPALVYSRYGYGGSDPLTESRRVDFMHTEALHTLPELLDRLGIEKPILFGHSDGASISLIYAGGTRRPVMGLILMAPHVMVEDICIRSIEAAKHTYETTDLRERLRRYHANPDSAFRGWNDVWLNPDFRRWNIEAYLSAISCPILAMQGEDDEYGTMEQIDRIARLARNVEPLKLPDCRHSPHRDQTEKVLAAVTRFVDKIRR
ncbi:MAG: alpha/beta fold hydrolase [Sulfurifustaceae bacterium]